MDREHDEREPPVRGRGRPHKHAHNKPGRPVKTAGAGRGRYQPRGLRAPKVKTVQPPTAMTTRSRAGHMARKDYCVRPRRRPRRRDGTDNDNDDNDNNDNNDDNNDNDNDNSDKGDSSEEEDGDEPMSDVNQFLDDDGDELMSDGRVLDDELMRDAEPPLIDSIVRPRSGPATGSTPAASRHLQDAARPMPLAEDAFIARLARAARDKAAPRDKPAPQDEAPPRDNPGNPQHETEAATQLGPPEPCPFKASFARALVQQDHFQRPLAKGQRPYSTEARSAGTTTSAPQARESSTQVQGFWELAAAAKKHSMPCAPEHPPMPCAARNVRSIED